MIKLLTIAIIICSLGLTINTANALDIEINSCTLEKNTLIKVDFSITNDSEYYIERVELAISTTHRNGDIITSETYTARELFGGETKYDNWLIDNDPRVAGCEIAINEIIYENDYYIDIPLDDHEKIEITPNNDNNEIEPYTKSYSADDDFRIKTSCENGIWTGIITDSTNKPIPSVKVTTHKSIRTNNPPEGTYTTNYDGKITLNVNENHGYIKLERSSFNTMTTVSVCEYEPYTNPPTLNEKQSETNKEIVIPQWVRNLAELWVNQQISDKEFSSALEFLIKQGTIKV